MVALSADAGIFGVLALGLGLGLLHALDADHVIAVTGLSGKKPGLKSSVSYCLSWALGHGITLLGVGFVALILKAAIPIALSAWAERMVGGVLILIGGVVFLDLIRNRLHQHAHDHRARDQEARRHVHWHAHPRGVHQPSIKQAHRHGHAAVLVGMVHGMAGSAPLLAVIPVASSGVSAVQGMIYILVFSVGVLAAMLVVGGVLGLIFRWASGWGGNILQGARGMAGGLSIGYGVFLLSSVA